jgi:hypothetical protein
MNYRVVKVTPNVVHIVDLGVGRSVTNDAENVVEEVNRQYPARRIIYRDTDGQWDELVHNNGVFVDFKFLNGNVPF